MFHISGETAAAGDGRPLSPYSRIYLVRAPGFLKKMAEVDGDGSSSGAGCAGWSYRDDIGWSARPALVRL